MTLHIALLCGGPSRERGISLNSARSFLDHTKALAIRLSIFYLHPSHLFYELSEKDLYSNTPADFDFKLSNFKDGFSEDEFLKRLQSIDLLFPLIHGAYGEDGLLQKKLEEHGIPFAGSSSQVCQRMFNKYLAHEWLKKHGFHTLPALKISDEPVDIASFWSAHKLQKAVVKPTTSGSSIGVKIANSLEEVKSAISSLRKEGFSELLLEPFSEDKEFTICVLEHQKTPVSLIPLEIAIEAGEILDYRKKYLPSLETRYYCPPRFSPSQIAEIRSAAEKLFRVFNIQGSARIDGWLSEEGAVRFSDLNPISGMEQNSFLFQQASRVGFSHTDLIEYLLNDALAKYGKKPIQKRPISKSGQKPVFVLMGGDTSEKQVSLLSGSNVWLKLLYANEYSPSLFLLDPQKTVWQLPYDFSLHHTVEEMQERCQNATPLIEKTFPLIQEIRIRLGLSPLVQKLAPQSMSFLSFLKRAKKEKAFVFLGLHGGTGEDGTLQRRLEKRGLSFNGSSAKASRLCMDKFETAKTIRSLKDDEILPMQQIAFTIDVGSIEKAEILWSQATKKFSGANQILIKPRRDGCSTGVVKLQNAVELKSYIELVLSGSARAKARLFSQHASPIEMPTEKTRAFLLEPFIETDKIFALDTKLCHEKISGWCEMTIGVLEKKGRYKALYPSLTIAANQILSVEEKFQGGTGINITPPPEEILSLQARATLQKNACKAAKALGIEGYARLDLFVECKTGKIRVIEANTLPALTPSTVLYHQALAETPPISPEELLIQIIESK